MQATNTPINNPLFAGVVPTACTTPTETIPAAYTQHIGNANFQYTQYFPTGTEFQASLTNNRTSTNLGAFNLYNPFLQSTLTLQVTQPLFRGFGVLPNTRLIIEAKNTEKVGLSQLSQQVMATVTQVSNDYWELVYARENVKVEEASVHVSQTLYDDNKTRAKIGTLSRLDVLTAQSQLASDKQALVAGAIGPIAGRNDPAQRHYEKPSGRDLHGIEIVPTTPISTPSEIENMRIEDAVKEAWRETAGTPADGAEFEKCRDRSEGYEERTFAVSESVRRVHGDGSRRSSDVHEYDADGNVLPGVPVVNSAGIPVPGLFEATALSSSSQVIFPGGLGEL